MGGTSRCLGESNAQPTFQDRRQRWSILASADWEGPGSGKMRQDLSTLNTCPGPHVLSHPSWKGHNSSSQPECGATRLCVSVCLERAEA